MDTYNLAFQMKKSVDNVINFFLQETHLQSITERSFSEGLAKRLPCMKLDIQRSRTETYLSMNPPLQSGAPYDCGRINFYSYNLIAF